MATPALADDDLIGEGFHDDAGIVLVADDVGFLGIEPDESLMAEGFADDMGGTVCLREEVGSLRKRVNDLKHDLKLEKRKSARLSNQLVNVQTDYRTLVATHNGATRDSGDHLTPHMGCDLALRRACGQTSIRNAIVWNGDKNISYGTMWRWEQKTSVLVLVHHRDHFADCELNVATQPPGDGLQFNHSHCCLRSDVTNNVHGKKFQTLNVDALYVISGECKHRSVWPEVEQVFVVRETPFKSAGEQCWGVSIRQLDQVGCPLFEIYDATLAGDRIVFVRSTYLTYDSGTDQIGGADIMETYLEHRKAHLLYRIACLKHHASNGQATSLKLADHYSTKWGMPHSFFSAVVKHAHILRNDRQTLRIQWGFEFGTRDADNATRVICPVPIASRWGTFDAVSDHIQSMHFVQQLVVLLTVTKPKPPAPKKGMAKGKAKAKAVDADQPHRSSGPLDETALDQIAYVRQKKGRWTRETHSSLQQPQYWLMMRLTHRCRTIWPHLLNCLQSKEPRLRELMCGTSDELILHCEGCLRDDAIWVDLFEGLDHPLLSNRAGFPDPVEINGAIVSFSACHATDFHRRVVRQITFWPHQVLVMSDQPADVVCERRRTAASTVLELEAPNATTEKLLALFKPEFEEAAATGKCPKPLFQYSDHASQLFWPDTQKIEGANKDMTLQFKKAPHTSSEFAKSRTVNKRYVMESVSAYDLDEKEKSTAAVKHLKELTEHCVNALASPRFGEMLKESLEKSSQAQIPDQNALLLSHHDHPPLADAAAAPAAAAAAPPAAAAAAAAKMKGDLMIDVQMRGLDVEGQEWASNWQLTWFRSYIAVAKKPTSAHLFGFHKPRGDFVNGLVWIVGTTHWYEGQLLACEPLSKTAVRILFPFRMCNTVELLQDLRFHVALPGSKLQCSVLHMTWESRTHGTIVKRDKLFDLQEVHPNEIKLGKITLGKKKGGGASPSVSAPKLLSEAFRLLASRPEGHELPAEVAAGLDVDDLPSMGIDAFIVELEHLMEEAGVEGDDCGDRGDDCDDKEAGGDDLIPPPPMAPPAEDPPPPSAVPVAPVASELSSYLVRKVHASMLEGYDVLQARLSALAHLFVGFGGNLSLCAIEGASRIVWVHWLPMRPGWGQLVELDARNRVIYPMPIRAPPQLFPDLFMVHPDVGVAARKVRGTERQAMPENMLKLRTMWQVAVERKDIDKLCFLCATPELPTARVTTCPVCLLSSHADCMRSFCTEHGSERPNVTPPLDVRELRPWRPLYHTSIVCMWCHTHVC